ncbi:hypothetical protein BREVNS_2381 [Brevinematales bacterium NS]|nr:hypothetical protein BREVNS_2381 [Brevinematales bacterium NS]
MHGCFLTLSGSGATPLFPAFSVSKGLFVSFYTKNRLLYYVKKYFYTTFCFLLLS